MFEHRSEPLIPMGRFALRVIKALVIAAAIDALALAVGTVGFHETEGWSWLMACVNAAMIITGNGLITQLHTNGGRIFSILDALFGVLAFVSVAGVVLAPIFHRILHAFHLEIKAPNG